jgi:predicted Zn-ribbon and HTH transcriptional regulator
MKIYRPTPETDAAQHEGLLRTNPIPMQVVTAEFARRLERERDEAREQNAKLLDFAERATKEMESGAALYFVDPARTANAYRAELDRLKEGAKCPVCTPEQKCWECAHDTSLKEGAK